jgi:hypothetical protein
MQQRRSCFRTALVLLPVFLAAAVAVNAQQMPQEAEPVEEEELEVFAEALQDVQDIQADMDQENNQVIGSSELTEDRFFEIHRAAQGTSGEQQPEGVSRGELQAYQETIEEITDVQRSRQSEMAEAVRENGLEVDRFNEILTLAQADRGLMERLNSYLN